MFFRWINKPATFYGYITKIYIKKLDVFMIIYFDNMCIDTKNKNREYIKPI